MNAGEKCAFPPAPSPLLGAGEVEPFFLEPLPLEVEPVVAKGLPKQGAQEHGQPTGVHVLADLEDDFDHLACRRRHMFGDDIGIRVVPRCADEVDLRAGGPAVNRDPPRAQGFGQLRLREPARHRERLVRTGVPACQPGRCRAPSP